MNLNHIKQSKIDLFKINDGLHLQEESSFSRYFDEEKPLTLAKKVSYRNIDIEADNNTNNLE